MASQKSEFDDTIKVTQIVRTYKVDTKTLYNWRKHKPELYSIVLLGFKFKELMQAQKDFLSELETIEQGLNERLRL